MEFLVKSLAHFRRGVGTTRLDALDCQFAPIDQLYPFGMPRGR